MDQSISGGDPSESITLSVPAASALLGISPSLGRELCRQGRFPGAFKIGNRRWRVLRSAFLAELERMAAGEPLDQQPNDILLARALREAGKRRLAP
jgi:hypothetical protein